MSTTPNQAVEILFILGRPTNQLHLSDTSNALSSTVRLETESRRSRQMLITYSLELDQRKPTA
jgi:hypothetical protein